MYDVAKIISDYLRSLCKNQYSIDDMQKFPNVLTSIPLLQDDKKEVSYDVDALFIEQLLINYIVKQINIKKKLMPVCLKLILRRLLVKLATECTFKLNKRFLKQVGGYTMGKPLSVTFSDIWSKWKAIVIPSFIGLQMAFIVEGE